MRARSRFTAVVLVALTLGGCARFARAADSTPDAYARVAHERAGKIVAALGLDDAAKSERVRDIVARQYADLRALHDARDVAVKTAKENAPADRAAADSAVKSARDEALVRQAGLHDAFLGRLTAELTPSQIDTVKDGMTYGVLPLTFRAYQELLPDLTVEQKAQICAWLVEAREHAMDAGSSQEKHAWFGKYKGRINNYLSAAGYNMKQAERDLAARRKATGAALRAEDPGQVSINR